MEELLPLIILIVWSVYSLYNRGKKKKSGKAKPAADKSGSNEPSFIEQLFAAEGIQIEEPFIAEEDESIAEETYVDISDSGKKEKEVATPFLRSELAKHRGEGMNAITDPEEEKEPWMREDFQFETDNIIIEEIGDFDLKKAVIYSEILNAPYIDYK